MLHDDAGKTALQAIRTGLRLEFGTDPGRLNALWISYGFVLIMVAGAPNLLVPLIKIWAPHYAADFPWLSVFAIYAGGFLVCVLLLVTLAAFIELNQSERPGRRPLPRPGEKEKTTGPSTDT